MILIHATCTPPIEGRVLHDQSLTSLLTISNLSTISPAGFAPVSSSWRRWRS